MSGYAIVLLQFFRVVLCGYVLSCYIIVIKVGRHVYLHKYKNKIVLTSE